MQPRCDKSKSTARRGIDALATGQAARCLAALAMVAAVVGHCASASAQDALAGQREYNVKAVSLYAFGRYVTWPDSVFSDASSPFVIGVIGENPFGDALNRIAAKKTLNGRPIEVRLLAAPAEAASCHMVFVSRMVTPEIETALVTLARGKPILLVGETPGFAQRGGIVNFYQSGANVRFELNPDQGAEAGLSLNAKLLSLGTKAATQ